MAWKFNPFTGTFDFYDASSGGTVTSIAGGVGLTGTPDPIVGAGTLDLDIASLTTEATLAAADTFPFQDASVSLLPPGQRKVTFANLVAATNPLLDHGGLLGNADDDHPGHPWLAGRATGQHQIGGTGSGEGYQIQSTSHPTRGDVSIVDRLHLRTTTPSAPLTALGTRTSFIEIWDATFTIPLNGGAGAIAQVDCMDWRPTIASQDNLSSLVFLAIQPTITQSGVAPSNFQILTAIHSAITSRATTNGVFPWMPDLMIDHNLVEQVGNGTPGAIVGTTPANYIYVGCLEAPTIRATEGATLTFTGVNSGVALYHCDGTLAATGAAATNSVLTVPYFAGFHYRGPTITTSGGGTVTLDRNAALYVRDHTAGTLQAAILSQLNTAAGKWFLYGEGTAFSLFGGPLVGGDGTTSVIDIRPSRAIDYTGAIRLGAGAGDYGTAGAPVLVSLWPDGARFGGGTMTSISGVALSSTILQDANAVVGLPLIQLFGDFHTHDPTDSAVTVLAGDVSFFSQPTIRNTHGSNITDGLYRAVQSNPTFSRTGAGTLTIGELTHYYASAVVNTGTTVTIRRGLRMLQGTLAGTVPTSIGVDVEAITASTLTAAVRSAIASATGAWAFLGTGSADSTFGGRIFCGATGSVVPNTDLDVDGDFATRAADLALANGNNDNIAIGARSFIRITGPTGAFVIRGIASGFNGKHLTIYNTTTQNLTINHEDAGSTAANRIRTMTGAAVTSTGECVFELVYDATLSRWLLKNPSAV